MFFVFVLCGCAKKGLSPTDFTHKMESQKYAITDFSDKNSQIVLAKGKNYSLYYYQFDSVELAKESLQHEITLLKEMNNNVKETNKDNLEKYVTENNDFYSVYSRIDNTYVYIAAPKKYKDEITKVLKNIGY